MDDYLASWREMLAEQLEDNNESWADVVASTLSEEELDRRFDPGFGRVEGSPFTVWTKKRVYFPTCYDGAEGIASVSRNPDGVATHHVGGG